MVIDTKFNIGDTIFYFDDSYFTVESGDITKVQITYDKCDTTIKYFLGDDTVVYEDESFATMESCVDDVKSNLLYDNKFYSSRFRDHI